MHVFFLFFIMYRLPVNFIHVAQIGLIGSKGWWMWEVGIVGVGVGINEIFALGRHLGM